MRKSIVVLAYSFLSLALSAQEIERSNAKLPEISEMHTFLDEAMGCIAGKWPMDGIAIISSKQKISTKRVLYAQ